MSDEMIAYGGCALGVALLAFFVFVVPRIAGWYIGKFIAPQAQKALHSFQKWSTAPAEEQQPTESLMATQLRSRDTEGSEVVLSHLEATKKQ